MRSAAVAIAMGLCASAALATPALETDRRAVVPSLLVQSSRGYSYEHGKLTLEGVSPSTVVFAERPERLTGHTPTEDVVAGWREEPESLEQDPPTADFSSFTADGTKSAVVQLRNPRLEGDELTYDVKIIQGRLQHEGGESSIFIDLIGRPATPLDGDGLSHRITRRAVFFR